MTANPSDLSECLSVFREFGAEIISDRSNRVIRYVVQSILFLPV